MKSPLASLQPLGRALMLPIAVLPVAGFLLRLGQADLLNLPFIASAGDAVFSSLGLLFAIGVAVGLAKDNNGAAGLAGAVCFLVSTAGAKTLIVVPPDALKGVVLAAQDLLAAAFKDKALSKLSVPLGILSGVIAGDFYNRFSRLNFPEYLAFFGGRRFVPIISGLAGLGLALIFGLGWSNLSNGMDGLSRLIVKAGPVGLFAYGFLNRLLIVTGLHHILNNVVWFLVGDYHGVTGDLHRFFAGDPTAGAFMSGYFPVMMFGLPGACLAMYHTAKPERRAAVGGMLLSVALTAFLTGVTEPIEFSFMFLAPALYAIHAVLTGLSMVLMDALGVKLGFGFSAGLFDYLLNFNRATRPLLLIPVGLVYGTVYYGLFRAVILRFDLKTPGRESEAPAGQGSAPAGARGNARGERFVAALGGIGNILEVGACTTRLRLTLAEMKTVDKIALKTLGARGVISPGPGALQVVLGPLADQVASEIRLATVHSPLVSDPLGPASPQGRRFDVAAMLDAMGGPGNLKGVQTCSSRLRCEVHEAMIVDASALKRLGVRAVASPTTSTIQVVIGPDAEFLGVALRRRLEELTDG